MFKPACPEKIDFTNQKQLYEVLSSIAMFNETQAEVTDAVTELRAAAIKQNKVDLFDEAIARSNELMDNNPEVQENGIRLKFRYTYDDFAATEKPYRDVFNQPSQFTKKQRLEVLAAEAMDVGYKAFKKSYDYFCRDMRKVDVAADGAAVANPTDFPLQPIELDAGEWRCSFSGVCRESFKGIDVACRHPIMPIERLVNIDTGEEKLKIAFFKGRHWREIIMGKKELFDASKIIQLAAVGVSVTSKTAKTLAEFMCDIEAMNYDIIPERESVSRLGYIGDGDDFSPYLDGITFDGDANYSTIYAAIAEHGSYEEWLESALEGRSDSTTAQIMLAASFSSVLVGQLGCLPFFVHLWGVDSGTGKSVALMLAASVWGNPEIGQYPQTFNATQVGHEKTAAFLNNIPMCIDELQLSKDSHGRSKFDVYQLAQGVGRTRGNKGGGVDKTPTWSLCILTTGESPITSDSAGAGAVNRVIDIECRNPDKVIKDGHTLSGKLRQNYGFAGRKFVEALTPEVIDSAKQRYSELFKKLTTGETTEKQAMAAAVILIGDELADRFIFKTGKTLTVEEISEFLKSKASASAGERGYAFMCDWVSANSNKFKRGSTDAVEGNSGDIYGIIVDDWAYINSSVFKKAAKDNGFDDRALLSWLRSNGLIQTRGRRFTKGKRINGVNTECVAMQLKQFEDDELDEYEDIFL